MRSTRNGQYIKLKLIETLSKTLRNQKLETETNTDIMTDTVLETESVTESFRNLRNPKKKTFPGKTN